MNQWNNINVTVLYKTIYELKSVLCILCIPSNKEYYKVLEKTKIKQKLSTKEI